MGGQYYKVVIIGDTKDVIHVWLDPYDYGDTVCLKWHGNDITKDYTKSLSEEEREKLVLELFYFYRSTGFN